MDRVLRTPYPAGVREAMVVSAQGGTAHRFVPSQPAGASEMDWSPSGDRVVFTGWGGGLYVSDADGTNATMLRRAFPRTSYGAPRWSPDGAHIVVDVHHATAGASWYDADIISPAEGTHESVAVSRRGIRGNYTISWSPDGRELVLYDPGETPAATGIHFLTASGAELHFLPGEYDGASWWAPAR